MIAAVLMFMGYLDLVEIAERAYDDARVEEYVREAETVGVQEHGFPRLAANLGQLIAAGRQTERKPMLDRMMTVSCACARRGKMPPKTGGNEFSVRELVSAVIALERAGAFPPEKIAAWKTDLAAVEPLKCYDSPGRVRLGEREGNNWPLFAAASEQARIRYGLGGDADFIETWVSDQLRHFDSNGMYRDPGEPAVYDFIGRLCYMMILHFGYDGPCRAKVEEMLVRSAEPTLRMLSVCGEIPYGGRSNQFLHNNTMYAAVAEWYAAFYAKCGDSAMSARFKSAARRAIAALEPWVKDGKVFHVKNRYPKPETKGARNIDQKWFGCEGYAYFDKYMVTMGSWAALAAELAKTNPLAAEETREKDGERDRGRFAFVTAEHFHWRFDQSANYTVQEDWNANPDYDASGIGRIHRRGAPPAICLSTPFTERPDYYIGVEKNPGPLAIAAEGGTMSYKVTDEGVEIFVEGPRLTLPAFEFDGEEMTRIESGDSVLEVRYRGWVCRYEARGGRFVDTGLRYFNRNGRYRRIDCTGRAGVSSFTVCVTIEEEPAEERESRLLSRLPDVFARSAAHYRALDAAVAPRMRDGKGGLFVPHTFFRATREVDMQPVLFWTAGHFPGSLWYLYEATGDAFFRDRALVWTENNAANSKVTDNHDIGFVMNCSFGNARRLLETDRYDALLVETADSLSKRFNRRLGLIRSWGALDETEHFLVIPDNLMNLELLELATKISGDSRFAEIARSHADVTMRNHFRDDGGVYHVLDYCQQDGRLQGIRRGQGARIGTSWSRGQSWAIYGYAMMYRETGKAEYLAFARKLADYAIRHPNMPADGIPYWDYGAPGEERDSSAGAVMAAGLLDLASSLPAAEGGAYRDFAVRQLLTLSSDDYFSNGDEIGHFILKHAVGNKPGRIVYGDDGEVDVPLCYGDYYFLEALVRFRNLHRKTK